MEHKEHPEHRKDINTGNDIMSKYDHLLRLLDDEAPTNLPPRIVTCEQAVERIEVWLRIVDNPPRNASKLWKDVADATEVFGLGCWAYAAVMAGWSDSALFALDEGLIPEKLRRGLHLMKLDANAATLMTGKGELEYFRRPRTMQPPWWQDPRVAAHHNTPAKAASERK